MKKATLVAKTVLLNDQHQVLILTRSGTAAVRPGGLDLPGGIIETNEDAATAASREIEEETGILVDLSHLTLVFSDTSFYEGETIIRFLFAAVLDKPATPKLSYEHSDYMWVDISEVEERLDHPVWVKGISYAVDHDLMPK